MLQVLPNPYFQDNQHLYTSKKSNQDKLTFQSYTTLYNFILNFEQPPKNGLKNRGSIVYVYMYVLPILIQTSMYTTTCKVQ